jgi:ATP/maltotriose-dependent transcriptional regulator MalT
MCTLPTVTNGDSFSGHSLVASLTGIALRAAHSCTWRSKSKGLTDEFADARRELLRGQISFAASTSGDASAQLVKAAKRLQPLDITLARQTYLEAWAAAYHAGQFAGAGSLWEVSRAARAAPPPAGVPRPSDLLLDGLAMLITEGPAAAGSALKRAAEAFASEEADTDEGLQWSWLAALAALTVWDEKSWHAMTARQLQSCREAGLLTRLVMYVTSMAQISVWRGEFAAAESLIREAEAIAAATGTRYAPYATVMLAGFRGAETEAAQLIKAVITGARAAGQGHGIQASHRNSATLYIGLGRYEEARAEAEQATGEEPALPASVLVLPELIEAASRTGQTQLAADALVRLAEATSIGPTDWGQGIYARCRALLSDGEDAEKCYRKAIDRLGRTSGRPELARAHLVYGEWLRREGRRTDAREQLRTAYDMFDTMGMEAFAGRTRRELAATGETVRKRTAGPSDQLTPQEAQIAQLARSGLPNLEIGAQLFLSPRTIEWHLRNIFTKLGISSRRQLSTALAQPGQAGRPA